MDLRPYDKITLGMVSCFNQNNIRTLYVAMEYGIFLRVYTILVAMLHYDLLPIVLSGLTSLTILAVTVKKGVIKISKIKVPLS